MESLKIQDYMNKRPVTFSINMTVAEAVERLLIGHQKGGPVVDANNKLVGFLSEQDCLEQMIVSSYYRERAANVDDIMNKEVLSVKPYHSVFELAQTMLKQRPRIYPVVDDNGLLLGTISRSDVLKAIDVQLQDGYTKHD